MVGQTPLTYVPAALMGAGRSTGASAPPAAPEPPAEAIAWAAFDTEAAMLPNVAGVPIPLRDTFFFLNTGESTPKTRISGPFGLLIPMIMIMRNSWLTER
jgi:hypothetical protein